MVVRKLEHLEMELSYFIGFLISSFDSSMTPSSFGPMVGKP